MATAAGLGAIRPSSLTPYASSSGIPIPTAGTEAYDSSTPTTPTLGDFPSSDIPDIPTDDAVARIPHSSVEFPTATFPLVKDHLADAVPVLDPLSLAFPLPGYNAQFDTGLMDDALQLFGNAPFSFNQLMTPDARIDDPFGNFNTFDCGTGTIWGTASMWTDNAGQVTFPDHSFPTIADATSSSMSSKEGSGSSGSQSGGHPNTVNTQDEHMSLPTEPHGGRPARNRRAPRPRDETPEPMNTKRKRSS
ncbi:hypothetical protein C2E23DRAFT_888156 [Lenzites betulinus]|nr:hypothetical protein C2E23DRAFT_888156 [Lenzites betulinus]